MEDAIVRSHYFKKIRVSTPVNSAMVPSLVFVVAHTRGDDVVRFLKKLFP
jgi:hypothetical protein